MKKVLLALALLLNLSAFGQQQFTWSQIADYPQTHWGMASCSYGQYMYSFSNCGSSTNNLYRYDATADKWDTLAKKSGTTTCNTTIIGANGKLYMAGQNEIYTYDIATDMWDASSIGAPNGFKKEGVVTVAVGDDIYFIGGGSPTSKNLFKLNTNTNTFTKLTDMSANRENAQVAYMNDKIYVIGGRSSGSALNSAEVYDITNDTWTAISGMFVKRYFGYAMADGNYVYLMGGETGIGSFKYKTIEVYDPSNNSVTILDTTNDMKREHTAYALGRAGNKLVAAAGFTNTPNNAITAFSEATNFTSTVSIMQQSAEMLHFKTYPNPANNVVNVQLSHADKVNTINLYNTSGQLVRTVAVQGNNKVSISLSELPTGTYILRAISSIGSQSQVLKVIH